MSADASGPVLPSLDNSLHRELVELGVEWAADTVPDPAVVVVNDPLAVELGLDPGRLRSPEGVAVLSGNQAPAGASPIAMAYAGHQFGHYSPRLGDGRALLLGELVADDESRVDVHLKGSGRTPFARGGDGKATLGPMLREYLMAEALAALGIPTGRALAVVTTGEQISRAGVAPTVSSDGREPGAVLTRVAASHLRVGTFEYAVRLGRGAGEEGAASVVQRLADYAIARHYPDVGSLDGPDRYLAFLERVVDTQAALVAQWMHVGFVHGVMNTDNMTISGETIDYGPCAFMDVYDEATVFSSIDHGGRYRYGNQPGVAHWNLTRLAETLLGLLGADPDSEAETEAAIGLATKALDTFEGRYRHHWTTGMRAKLGLASAVDGSPADDLAIGYVEALQAARLDYTSSFRDLARSLRREPESTTAALGDWVERWRAAVGGDPVEVEVAAAMDAVNPIHVPRNHLVDEALTAAVEGDLGPFEQLLAVLADPFTERPGGRDDRYASPAPDSFSQGFQTYCGT